jgi:FMN reductase (NADPH)
METIDFFTNHTSVRDFKKQPLSAELKQQLVTVAQSGSSSNFVQAYSIIEIKDPKKLAEIEKLANAPHYITQTGVFYLFVADLYKHHQFLQQANLPNDGISNMEALLVSVVDTTIAAQNMAAYAESQDLGICYIGGIRNDLFRVAELTELPSYTLPLFGLTIGYPATKNEPKVRLPQAAILNVDRYQPLSEEIVDTYNEATANYYAHRGSNQQTTDWQTKMTNFFQAPRRPEVESFLTKQGFLVK